MITTFMGILIIAVATLSRSMKIITALMKMNFIMIIRQMAFRQSSLADHNEQPEIMRWVKDNNKIFLFSLKLFFLNLVLWTTKNYSFCFWIFVSKIDFWLILFCTIFLWYLFFGNLISNFFNFNYNKNNKIIRTE